MLSVDKTIAGEPLATVDPVALETLEDLQERNVRLGDGLVEPVLLEEVVVFGVADERQMSVQNEAKVSQRWHRAVLLQKLRGNASLRSDVIGNGRPLGQVVR